MKTYWERLKNHPGVPIATVLTFVFPLAGLGRENNWQSGVIAGAAIAALLWAVVLWSNRYPTPDEIEDGE